MGNRLSKIVTRTGDGGTTGLGDGSRVPKDCLRIAALGAVEPVSDAARQYLNRLSDLLFVLGCWLNKSSGGSDILWQHERGK